MAKSEQCLPSVGFDYGLLETAVAERVRLVADRIRKYDLQDTLRIGDDLLAVKNALPRLFGRWLSAEFDWTERTARNYISVAVRFGSHRKLISDLAILPTAALLLAAASVPEQARERALVRALGGERITTTIARQIIADVRRALGLHLAPPSTARRRGWLVKVLDRCGLHCNSNEFWQCKGQLLDQFDLHSKTTNAKGAIR